jgi:DNA helicase-2/ATP-dependent DNA helicase PcrA
LDNPDSLDEERRLMYVAATRAEEYLYFTCPLEIGFEAGPMSRPRVSRFLSDLPRELYESQDRPSEKPPAAPKSKTASPPTTPNPTSAGGLKPGQRVSHPVFGLGKVVRVMKDRKIRVDFDHYGAKTLHLDFAGLKNTG